MCVGANFFNNPNTNPKLLQHTDPTFNYESKDRTKDQVIIKNFNGSIVNWKDLLAHHHGSDILKN